MSINWKNIKGYDRDKKKLGHKSAKNGISTYYKDNYFEELAIEYLNRNNLNQCCNWRRTRDNNIGYDGCLFVYDDNDLLNIWMEAKYSYPIINVPRSRFNSTIIEVVFNSNIKSLYLITNCTMTAKTKFDLIRLIKMRGNDTEVTIITKSMLEYWISNNQDVYMDFFSDSTEILGSSEAVLIQDIEIFNIFDKRRFTDTPIIIFNTSFQYCAMISIFVPFDCEAVISSRYFNITTKKFKLKKGENNIETTISAKDILTSATLSKANIIFKFNNDLKNIKCYLNPNTSIQTNDKAQLTLMQSKAYDCIASSIMCQDSIANKNFIIKGNSGHGKSFLLKKIANDIPSNASLLYETFQNDKIYNAKKILQSILFAIFPYAIDENDFADYKSIIQSKFNSGEFLYKLANIDVINNPLKLVEFLSEYNGEFLFTQLDSNTHKIIFWDDFQKLDSGLKSFAYNFIKKLVINNNTLSLIVSTQDIKSENLQFIGQTLDCNICIDDINSLLNTTIPKEFITFYFPDLLILFAFKEFCNLNQLPLMSGNDFLLHYAKFFKDDGLLVFLRLKLLNLNTQESLILNRIYYSLNGIPLISTMRDSIHSLIQCNLIKESESRLLIPFHDHYARIYKNEFEFDPSGINLINAQNDIEKLKFQLYSLSNDMIDGFMCHIKKYKEAQDFFTVYYILEDLEKIGFPPQLLTEFYYLKFYKIYADANIKISGRRGYEQFAELLQQLHGTKCNKDLSDLYLITLFETSNGAYDNMDYFACSNYENQFFMYLNKMECLGFNVNTNKILSLKRLIRQMTQLASFECGKSADLQVNADKCEYRILRSQLSTSQERNRFIAYAKSTVNDIQLHANKKEYLKADFDWYYIQCSIDAPKNWYQEITAKRDRLKSINTYYYTSATYGIISLLLSKGVIDEARFQYHFLSAELSTENPRRKGYRYQIDSAFAILDGDKEKAIKLLNNQLNLFKNSGVYLNIIKENVTYIKDLTGKVNFQFAQMQEEKEDVFLLDLKIFY
ncbi:MAG: hypothetical protein R3Y45_09360 [Bacillota bacterium]